MQIKSLTVNTYQAFGNTHHAFDAGNRRQTSPLKQANRIKGRIGIKDPAAGLVALTAVEAPSPALVGRQAERGQTFFLPVTVRMFGTFRQRCQIPAR